MSYLPYSKYSNTSLAFKRETPEQEDMSTIKRKSALTYDSLNKNVLLFDPVAWKIRQSQKRLANNNFDSALSRALNRRVRHSKCNDIDYVSKVCLVKLVYFVLFL